MNSIGFIFLGVSLLIFGVIVATISVFKICKVEKHVEEIKDDIEDYL